MQPPDRPFVSIIIPCRNEAGFIASCLDSIISNNYPRDRLEVLVVDGMSEDQTAEIVESYAHRGGFIRLLRNPKKITPAALNLGIMGAKGQIIMRVDSHARIQNDYISRAVEALEQHNVDNVGGNMVTLPREEGFIAQAIVASVSHPFGVGNSHFRIHANRPALVDTVFGGCYRRDVFEKIGLFNERLPSSQDMEFNRRLLNAGGKILLVPTLVSYYYQRSDVKSFCKNNFRAGVWAVLPFAYSSVIPVSLRHLVPLVFVASLAGSAALSFLWAPFFYLLWAITGIYLTVCFAASLMIARRERDFRFLGAMPLVFGMLHFGYGIGSFWGIVKLVRAEAFWKKVLG